MNERKGDRIVLKMKVREKTREQGKLMLVQSEQQQQQQQQEMGRKGRDERKVIPEKTR
jgi:hypothetical protein